MNSVNLDKLAELQSRAETDSRSSPVERTTTAPSSIGSADLPPVLARIQVRREAFKSERVALAARDGKTCWRCLDTGWQDWSDSYCRCPVGSERVSRDRMAHVRRWLASIDGDVGIPAKFRDLTLESFPDQASPALAAVRSWLDGDLDVPGLFLCGLFGRGKTGLVIAALRSVVAEYGVESSGGSDPKSLGCFTTTTWMLESLRPQDKGETTNAASLRRYRSVRWLALDDIGAERLTEWGADRLFEVINHRHNAVLPMLVTSNLSPNELAQKINRQVGDASGNRIVERLIESCTVIRFDDAAPNWRLAR